MDLTWVALPTESPLVGRTIPELRIRTLTGATVVGVMRHETLFLNPELDYRFAPGDLVAVIGHRGQLEAFRTFAVPTDIEVSSVNDMTTPTVP